MKKIRLEPLKIIIIPIILLLFSIGMNAEYPWEEEGTVSITELTDETANDSSSGEETKKIANESSSGGETKEIPDGYIKMTLVVGKKGSLKDNKIKNNVVIYEEPDSTSSSIGNLEYNCAVAAKEEQDKSYYDDGWICVELPETKEGEGYIYWDKELIRVVNVAFGSEDPFYNKIIKDSLKYIGKRFVSGGNSLENGIDCSHFVSKIYKMNGMTIPQKPRKQRKKGTLIDNEEKQPGDIIFYDQANNGTGHVGIYLGDGYVDNPDEYSGGFVINVTGHSGETYPEGGVRIVCLLYPDRDHYEVVRFSE